MLAPGARTPCPCLHCFYETLDRKSNLEASANSERAFYSHLALMAFDSRSHEAQRDGPRPSR